MFKKIMSFLFEEEEIVEEVHQKPIVKPVISKSVTEEPVLEEPVAEKPKSIFVDLEQQEVTPLTPVVEPKKEPIKTTVDSVPLKRPVRKPIDEPLDYEFSSSISPIFGKKQEKEKEVIMVQPKIELETSKSVLGTIISPIYGVKNNRKVTKKVEKAPVVTSMSLEDVLGVHDHHKDVLTQLSLDEPVVQPQVDDKDDVLMKLFEEDME